MNTKMAFTFCSGLAVVALALALVPRVAPADGDVHADGAYRDGVFQANLAFEKGGRPHLAAGRWNSEKDRFAFVSGYQQQWHLLAENHKGKVSTADEAHITGYWDGLVEGAGDGRSSVSTPAGRAEESARIHSSNYTEGDKQHYLAGFTSGYKVGYFAQHDGEGATLTSQRF